MANIDVSRLFFARETVGFSCRTFGFSCEMCWFFVQNALYFWREFISISYRMNCRTHTLEDYTPSFSFTKFLKPDCRPRHLARRNQWQNDRLFETR